VHNFQVTVRIRCAVKQIKRFEFAFYIVNVKTVFDIWVGDAEGFFNDW